MDMQPPRGLIGLPPELFKPIIHHVVAEIGGREAWKLRQVCRKFAGEIEEEVFVESPWTLEPWTPETERLEILEEATHISAKPVMWLYVYLHTCKRHGKADQSLPDKIKAMADYLCHERGRTTDEERDECLRALCKMVARNCEPSELRMLLHGGNPEAPRHSIALTLDREALIEHLRGIATAPLSTNDKLGVAAGIGSVELVKSLLPEVRYRHDERSRNLFGHALTNAAATGNFRIVREISTYLNLNRDWPSSNYNDIVDQLRYDGFRCFITYRGAFDEALAAAMQECETTTMPKLLLEICMMHLLWFRKDTFPPRDNVPCQMWFDCAVVSGKRENVRLILDNPYCEEETPWVGRNAFNVACRVKSPSVAVELLKYIPPNTLFYPYKINGAWGYHPEDWENYPGELDGLDVETPLTDAIRYGNTAVVGAVLDAGADVDGVRCVPEDEQTVSTKIVPLHLAISLGKWDIAKILVERGCHHHVHEARTFV